MAGDNSQFSRTIAAARAYVLRELEMGAEFIPSVSGGESLMELKLPEPVGVSVGVAGNPRPEVEELPDLLVEPELKAAATLDEVRSVLGDCRRCKLCTERTNIVFGVGNPEADVMFVGEGPGADEDTQGIPFVGRAGKLLTDIIEKGMRLQRGDVYIANIVKCRPPQNRNPEPDEIVACEPFLARQISVIRPRVIVSLGRVPTQSLLQNRIPISKQRGTWHEYRGVPVMPTFHPAYLLRSPSEKRVVWEDIKQVMNRIGLPVS